MTALRSRLTVLALLASLAALPGCATDDAVERDTKDAAHEVDKAVDSKPAKDAADDAGDAVKKAVEDVDGR